MIEFLKVILNIITKKEVYGVIVTLAIAYFVYRTSTIILDEVINYGKNNYEKKKRKTITKLFKNIVKYLILMIAVLTILSIYGVNVGGMVAGLGITATIIGLALQDTFKDIINGINIIVENYFIVGDIIEYDTFTGEVIEFGLKSTKIKNAKGEVKIVANRNIMEIKNLSQESQTIQINIPLPYEEDVEKTVYERHFTQMIMQSPKLSNMYFSGKKILSYICLSNVEEIINILHQEILFSHEEYKQINGIIQNVYGMNEIDEREVKNKKTLGAIIKKRSNAMNMLDQNQFNGIYNKINNHARIRGLAGSGKTILLVKKMAYTHFKNPELELAYIFYTKSLKQYIKDLFVLYYKDFEKYKQPDMKKIHILHSWGGNEMTGFYSKVCEDNSLKYRSWLQAKSLKGIDKYDAVCEEVLDVTKGNINKTYDYVFIDEAQDFNINFFKLALKTLRYTGKLIYAYDELQSLNSVNPMPSKNMIFSKEECEDIDLSVCYRTPKEILVTAHALGLGIYKKKKDGSPDIV